MIEVMSSNPTPDIRRLAWIEASPEATLHTKASGWSLVYFGGTTEIVFHHRIFRLYGTGRWDSWDLTFCTANVRRTGDEVRNIELESTRGSVSIADRLVFERMWPRFKKILSGPKPRYAVREVDL